MITAPEVEAYLRGLVPADAVLADMRAHGERDGIPILDAESARLLLVLTLAAGARRAVEVGTAIGVSTLHLAWGVGAGGSVVTFEIDAERQAAARGYLTRAGVADRVDLRLKDGAEGLEALEPGIDVAFLDGVKSDYARHLELALGLLRPGGLVVADNALLSGAVASGTARGHWTQEAVDQMRALNQRAVAGPGLTGMVVPIGDGMAVAVKT